MYIIFLEKEISIMRKKMISVLISISLMFGLISANATSIVFEDINETEENIYFEDIEAENEIDNINFEEINSSEATNISNYSNDMWDYSYTGKVEEFVAPYTGSYRFVVKSASGGGATNELGGKGGTTIVTHNMKENEKVYLCIGGEGNISTNSSILGGYNGGGNASNGAGSGGGATSITTTNRGELINFENYKDEVLLVVGGGGGQGSNQQNIRGFGRYDPIGNGGSIGGYRSTISVDLVHLFGGSLQGSYEIIGDNNSFYSSTSSNIFGKGEDSNPTNNAGYGGAGGGGYYGGSNNFIGLQGGAGGNGYMSEKMYDSEFQIATHIGDGSVKISYLGKYETSITINTNNICFIDGKSGYISFSAFAGDDFLLPIPTMKDGYAFKGYEIISGNGEIKDGKYIPSFDASILKVKFDVDLTLKGNITGNLNSNTQKLTLNFEQPDDIEKVYRVYQSLNQSDWYFANYAEDVVNGKNPAYIFNYTGGQQTLNIKYDSYFQMKVYGASGGDDTNATGGYGGYAYGEKEIFKNTTLYIIVGEYGKKGWNKKFTAYNGGGTSGDQTGAGGGGATHIATASGQLYQFSNASNASKYVLLVAGGGGGAGDGSTGGSGGGTSGGLGTGSNRPTKAGNQTSGYSFGRGQAGNGQGPSGGGGWYGGYAVTIDTIGSGASGGSGWIGGVQNGKMQNGKRKGNGYAEITLTDSTISDDYLTDIYVPDRNAPDKPSNIHINSVQDDNIIIDFTSKDNGTTYYHQVKSYDANNKDILLKESEILETEITTGIKGYYYYIDTKTTGTVTTSHTFVNTNSVSFNRPTTKSYLHIAAIDNAGNISETANFEIPSIANYTVKYYKMDLNGNYVLNESIVKSETIGSQVTPEVKVYEGFTTPEPITKTVLADGNTEISYYYERNKYEVTYIDKTPDGKEIGRTTKLVYYDSDVRGSELGDNKTDNKYYPQYKYVSDTTAKVTTEGAIVYRIFEFCKTEAEANLKWNDSNNKDGFRPSKYKLTLKQNGIPIDEVELPSDTTNYTFPNLPKYDSAGKPYDYSFEVDATDRYSINFDEDGNLIVEDYQPASFSVIIPKTIILDGSTGIADYIVSINGTFYYNDTLTVIPENNLTLIDRSNISSMKADVLFNKTTFTKEDISSTINGTIQTEKQLFAGQWRGTFNFDIKFIMKN